MEYIVPIIFGVVQGLTEFIPVSSSGHLLLLHEFFPSFVDDELAFDVALHVGTLLAALSFFWKDVVRYARAGVQSLGVVKQHGRGAWNQYTQDEKIAWLLVFAMIPAGVAGLSFEGIIESVFRSSLVVIVMLVLVGIGFFWVERWAKKQQLHGMDQMKLGQAIAIGSAQILALVPGTSRSGITILAGMRAGLSRAEAARFSFLMSMPLIAGAGLKKGIDLATVGVNTDQMVALVLGALSAAIVGYLAIAALLQYLSHRSLSAFGVYRIILAIVMLGVLYF